MKSFVKKMMNEKKSSRTKETAFFLNEHKEMGKTTKEKNRRER